MKLTIRHHQTETILHYETPVLLSKALQDAALSFPMPCAGRGICGKCAVQVTGMLSDPLPQEASLPKEMRLACLTQALGDCILCWEQNQAVVLTDGELPEFIRQPTQSGFGLAVDIGTTTVAVYLYDLEDAAYCGKASFPNPQISFGADVVSRIQAALDGQAETLQQVLLTMLETEAVLLCQTHKIDFNQVQALSITGNTTMLHLLTKTSVEPLSHAPFAITERFGKAQTASAIGFRQFGAAELYLAPTISAFVGSDITCAIQSTELCRGDVLRLLIDVGTNGEMALWDGKELFCCSTAAGPAFEGAGISSGMPAGTGAIDKAFTADGKFICTTIDDAPARGICGSGLIDAVAAFLTLGCIDETGCIDEDAAEQADCLAESNDEPALCLTENSVLLTGRDIREVQLAKAAICAGIESLLHASGHPLEDVKELLLAGGFGSFIDCRNAAKIGLIPPVLADRARTVGNAAGMGAVLNLLSAPCREESTAIASAATVLDLSSSAYFMERYVEQMMF